MKRRTFIKKSSIGLTALAAGATGATSLLGSKGKKRRVYGIPDSVRPRTPLEHDLARYSLARTDLPPQAWRDVVALSLLAQDVFDNPEVARAFSRDSRGYLRSVGLEDVDLDPNAVEVKVALALGDPELRAAVDRNDPRAFLQGLEHRDLLRAPETSQLASHLSSRIEAAKASLAPGGSPEACTLVVVCVAAAWIVLIVVQDAVAAVAAAVAVSLYAYTLVSIKIIGPKKMIDRESLRELPSFKLAGALGGPDFADRAMNSFVEENVEKIATAVESLDTYRENRPMDETELRRLIRVQMLRQLDGHAVRLAPVRP